MEDATNSSVLLGFDNVTSLCSDDTTPSVIDSTPKSVPVWESGILSFATVEAFFENYSRVSLGFCIAGTLCSVVSITLYAAQQRKNKGKTAKREAYVSFLIAVCVGDGLFTLSQAMHQAFYLLLPPSHTLYVHSILILDLYAITIFRRSAVWMNALASLERFLTIAFPLGGSSHLLKHAPTASIIIIFLVCILAHIYMFFEYSFVKDVSGQMMSVQPSTLRQTHPDLFITIKSVVRVVCFYLPLFGSLLINIMLIVALRRHEQRNKGMKTSKGRVAADSSTALSTISTTEDSIRGTKTSMETKKANSNEAKATKLVLALTLTFFCMALPSTLNATLGSFIPQYGAFEKEFYLYSLVLDTSNLIMYLTQVATFVISVIFSQSFRRLLVQFITVCLGRG